MARKSLSAGKRVTHARAPTFEVRQMKFSTRWFVRVLWRCGEEQHIGGFVSASDAAAWINKASAGWLRDRTVALRGV